MRPGAPVSNCYIFPGFLFVFVVLLGFVFISIFHLRLLNSISNGNFPSTLSLTRDSDSKTYCELVVTNSLCLDLRAASVDLSEMSQTACCEQRAHHCRATFTSSTAPRQTDHYFHMSSPDQLLSLLKYRAVDLKPGFLIGVWLPIPRSSFAGSSQPLTKSYVDDRDDREESFKIITVMRRTTMI